MRRLPRAPARALVVALPARAADRPARQEHEGRDRVDRDGRPARRLRGQERHLHEGLRPERPHRSAARRRAARRPATPTTRAPARASARSPSRGRASPGSSTRAGTARATTTSTRRRSAAQRERLVASAFRSGDVDGVLAGAWIGHLVGAGDRIAVNRFTTDTAGNDHPGLAPAAGHRPVDARARVAVALRRVARSSPGRGAAHRPHGRDLRHRDRRLLLTIRPTSAHEIALRKDYLVVLTATKTLEVYNSHTGALLKRWPVAAGASRLDVHSGIAAYAVGRTVFDLRLADGRDAPLATAPRAIEGLADRGARDRLRLQHVQGPPGRR